MLLTRNSIRNNGNWEVTKTDLHLYVLGSEAFYKGRQALSQSRLNLGAWHGFQEVISRKVFPIKEVSFSFHLEKGAYLYFVFNKTRESANFYALRLSSDPRFKNFLFLVSSQGKFLERIPVLIPTLEFEQWHHCSISFSVDSFTLSLNNKILKRFSIPIKETQMIGFRGGYKNTYVDDVITSDKDHNVLLKESFSNNKDILVTIGFVLILVLILHSLFALLSKKRSVDNNNIFFGLITFNLAASFTLMIASLFYFYFYTDMYTNEEHFRKREERWIASQTQRIAEDTKMEIEKEHNLPTYRIMFVGSSQTWGAGASYHSETFVHRIARRLNGELKGKYHVTCLNISISGEDSAGLYEIYKKFIRYDPKLVILNLSNNDHDAKVFEDSLDRFLRSNEEKDIDTLFILEANSIEAYPAELPMHPVMRRSAKQSSTKMIDLHHYLKEHYDEGLLWWDSVHLTSFGHELAARRILKEIREFLYAFLNKGA
jgi:lysophospholipase L1-like esterase